MRILKIAAVIVGGIILVAVAAFATAVWLGERKLKRTLDIRVVPIAAAKEPAALRHGKYLFETRGCAYCHGADGGGKVMIDDGNARVRTPNLTAARASAVASYTDADWVRSIRHGVDPRGRALVIMPSEAYNRLNDTDLAALVGYVKSLAPVEGPPAELRIPMPLKALYGLGVFEDAAEKIDHKLPPPAPVAAAVTPEHGAYLSTMCTGCHGANLAGGTMQGPPGAPVAANLTPGEGGVMGRYDTPDKFIAMMRTGKRPDGTAVSKVMPFESLKTFNDLDLQAMHAYLKTLPPKRLGER